MEIALMNDDAIIHTRASKGSAELDLYSNIDVDIDTNSSDISPRKYLWIY